MNTGYRRTKIVVDQGLQRSVVLSAIWPASAAFVGVAACLLVLHLRLDGAATDAGVELQGVMPMLVATYLMFVSAIGFVAFHALRLSFRIAGPLFRFRSAYEEVMAGEGNVRVRLREGDLLGNAADDLNRFLEWLERERQGSESRTEAPLQQGAPQPSPADAAH